MPEAVFPSQPSPRRGPALTVVASCQGCAHEHTERYRAQGDSGSDVYCKHPAATANAPRLAPNGYRVVGDTRWDTPAWCPLLNSARRDLIDTLRAEASS